MKMKEVRNHVTERILNLTLEIIYLLTGESFPPVKSGDHVTITFHAPTSVTLEKNSNKKILEVTNKITKLLTGESGNLVDHDISVKEEFIKEDEEYGVMKELSGGHKDLYNDIMMEPSSNKYSPVRCPRPLYSWDSTQEDHNIPHSDQDEDLINIKVEGEVVKIYVGDDQQYTEEAEMTRTFIEEDTPTEIGTGHTMEKSLKNHLTLYPDCNMEDKDITRYSGGRHTVHRPSTPSEQSCTVRDGALILGEEETFSCPDFAGSSSNEVSLSSLQRLHLTEKPHPFSECGKCCSQKDHSSRHQRWHRGEKTFSCPDCGKCYSRNTDLVTHVRSHTGERPFSCPECGQRYPLKSTLARHLKSHTGEKPYSCSECGKCFLEKAYLSRHIRTHIGVKPYSCHECGRYFRWQSDLLTHQRSHTGEKPYSCHDCGKCFSGTSNLHRHQKIHIGEKTYSSP